jgi:peptidoglycan/LPS O-acetylase OafA/YrhL
MAAPHSSPARLDSLTGLRWFAAFAVFFFHAYPLLHGVPGANLRGTFSAATAGVSFFFILSGFVLAWSWVPQRSARSFWRDRLARIWPNHAVTWLAATLVFAPVAFRAATARTLFGFPSLTALGLGQAWIPSQRWYYAGNLVSWSLSCEAFFYLCFPAIIVAVTRARRPWALLAGAVGTSFAVAAIGASMSHSLGMWWGYLFPPARLAEFVAGVVLARLVREERWPRLPLAAVLAVAVAAVGCARWLPWTLMYAAGTVVPLGALVATAASAELAGGARLLRRPWLVRLGEISFAFYLVHLSVLYEGLKRIHWRPAGGVRDVGVAVALLAASMAAAWLLNVAVEQPAQRLLRSKPRRKPDGDEPAADALAVPARRTRPLVAAGRERPRR